MTCVLSRPVMGPVVACNTVRRAGQQAGEVAAMPRRPRPRCHSVSELASQQQCQTFSHRQHQQQTQHQERCWRRQAISQAGAAAAAAADADLPLTACTAAPALAASSELSVEQETGIAAALDAFYRFTRPHTMLGTAVSVCSVSALAAGGTWGVPALAALGQALAAALLMNICIVGINQLYDIEIDRVNKPYLPLAAGDMSVSTGFGIVSATGLASLGIALASGSTPLLATVGGSLLLGIAYSTDLPLLRWKRSPVLAAACILSVRAVLVQLGFFAHMQQALGSATLELSRPILFATGFMLVFSIVIALFKDIPDVLGDQRAGLRTLSVRWGAPRVFWTCIGLLELGYLGALGVGLSSSLLWSRVATTAAHTALGAALLWRARRTDLTSSKSIYDCYMWVWALFYTEYLLLPLFR